MKLPAQVLIRYEFPTWRAPDVLFHAEYEIKAGAEAWRQSSPPADLALFRVQLGQLGYKGRHTLTRAGTAGSRSNPSHHLETWVLRRNQA